jgi:ankyrin repeat protein
MGGNQSSGQIHKEPRRYPKAPEPKVTPTVHVKEKVVVVEEAPVPKMSEVELFKSAFNELHQQGKHDLIPALVQKFMPHKIFELKVQRYDHNKKQYDNDWLFFQLMELKLYDTCLQFIESEYYNPEDNAKYIANTNDSYLSWAIFRGQTAIVEAIIKKGNYLPAQTDCDKYTTLTLACKHQYPEVALMLLDQKEYSDTDLLSLVTNSDKKTALSWALYRGYVNVVNIILTRTVNTYKTFYDAYDFSFEGKLCNDYLFFICVKYELYDVIIQRTKSHKFAYDVTSKLTGNTVLATILENSYLHGCVSGEYTANIICNDDGDNLLSFACKVGKTDLANKLLKDYTIGDFMINKKDTTAACYALKNDMVDIAKTIYDMIVDADKKLEIADETYRKLTCTILKNIVKMDRLDMLEHALTKFRFDKQDVLAVYNKSNKEARAVIMKHYDISDQAFIIEKYGVEVLSSINNGKDVLFI